MPRRARIVAGGYPMHVILRGIDRTAIFFDDSDYRFFLDYLSGAADDGSVGVHAYVLMTNHVHLLTPLSDRSSFTKPWLSPMMPGTPPIGTCLKPSWTRACFNACESAPTAASCSATSALRNRLR